MRSLVAGLILLLSTQAFAASRVWIAEFATVRIEAQAAMVQLPSKVRQTLDFTTGVQTSLPFDKATRYIRIVCEKQCAFTATAGEIATPNAILLPALRPEVFGVQPGATLSVIAAP